MSLKPLSTFKLGLGVEGVGGNQSMSTRQSSNESRPAAFEVLKDFEASSGRTCCFIIRSPTAAVGRVPATHTHTHTHTHGDKHTHTHTGIHTWTNKRSLKKAHTQKHTHMHANKRTRTHKRTHTHTNKRTHIHTHTDRHTRKHTSAEAMLIREEVSQA